MPNGHGGIPFMGAPVLLGLLFAILAAAPLRERFGWAWVTVCLVVAALAGWRLAYHLHMRAADDYGGAYTSAETSLRAVRRYRILAPVYAALAAAAGFAILWWRGLP